MSLQTSQIPSNLQYKLQLQHLLQKQTPSAPRALVYCSQKMRLFLFSTPSCILYTFLLLLLLLLTGTSCTPSMSMTVGSLLPKPVLLKAQATRSMLTLWWAPPSIQQRAESFMKPGRTAGPHMNSQTGGVQRQTQRALQERVEHISRFEVFLVRNDDPSERQGPVSLAIEQQSHTFKTLGVPLFVLGTYTLVSNVRVYYIVYCISTQYSSTIVCNYSKEHNIRCKRADVFGERVRRERNGRADDECVASGAEQRRPGA